MLVQLLTKRMARCSGPCSETGRLSAVALLQALTIRMQSPGPVSVWRPSMGRQALALSEGYSTGGWALSLGRRMIIQVPVNAVRPPMATYTAMAARRRGPKPMPKRLPAPIARTITMAGAIVARRSSSAGRGLCVMAVSVLAGPGRRGRPATAPAARGRPPDGRPRRKWPASPSPPGVDQGHSPRPRDWSTARA